VRGLLDEGFHGGGERVVGVLHEHVALLEDAEQVDAAVGGLEHVRRLRRPRLVLELGSAERVQAPQPAEVERSLEHGDGVVIDLELALQHLAHALGHGGVDLEPHDAPELRPPVQDFFDRFEQVLVLVLQLEVGVARDPERVVREDVHPGEQTIEVRRDHLLDRHEAGLVGQRQEPRQHGRDLHAGEPVVARLRVAYEHRKVQREIRDVRERV
jgi:hypothetical protein